MQHAAVRDLELLVTGIFVDVCVNARMSCSGFVGLFNLLLLLWPGFLLHHYSGVAKPAGVDIHSRQWSKWDCPLCVSLAVLSQRNKKKQPSASAFLAHALNLISAIFHHQQGLNLQFIVNSKTGVQLHHPALNSWQTFACRRSVFSFLDNRGVFK